MELLAIIFLVLLSIAIFKEEDDPTSPLDLETNE